MKAEKTISILERTLYGGKTRKFGDFYAEVVRSFSSFYFTAMVKRIVFIFELYVDLNNFGMRKK